MTYTLSPCKHNGDLRAVADAEGSLQSDTLFGLKQFPLLPGPFSTLLPCETVDMFGKLQVLHGAEF